MKDKPGEKDKDAQEGPALKTAGPEGEITAGQVSQRLSFRLNDDINLLFDIASWTLT